MRDAEDRVALPRSSPSPEIAEPLPEALPVKTGFKTSLNTSVNKLLNKKPAAPAEPADPDAIRVSSHIPPFTFPGCNIRFFLLMIM